MMVQHPQPGARSVWLFCRHHSPCPRGARHSLLRCCYSLLHLAQLHSHYQLCLGRHVLEDIRLEPPQHVGTQQVMELFDLVLLGDVCKLLQESFQVTAKAATTQH